MRIRLSTWQRHESPRRRFPQSLVVSWLIPALAALALLPFVSGAVALFAGAALGLTVGNPSPDRSHRLTHRLLTIAVVGLGAGMDFRVVGRAGLHGVGYTAVSLAAVIAFGTLLGRLLATNQDVSLLITVGTAICGGSAIAAVAPVIRAKQDHTSIALAIVFVLNAAALFAFPIVGHAAGLTQAQFGLWSALAIHDTSSVVGATMQYGTDALMIGTTVKLARTLWIVPVTFAIGMLRSRQTGEAPARRTRPWFVAGFLIVAALVTWLPFLRPWGQVVGDWSRRLLVAALFLIGTGLTRQQLRTIGPRPLAQGFSLWIIVAIATLVAIRFGGLS